MFGTHSQEEQLQFLRQSARLEESAAPINIRRTGLLIAALVWIFVLWGAITKIEEVAQAPGEIVPLGLSRIVQHYEGGIVADIKVLEGSLVAQGDLLLVLDGAGAIEELNRSRIALQGFERDVEVADELLGIQERLVLAGLAPKVRYLEAMQEFNQAQSLFEQEREVVARLKDRAHRLEIRAPVTGIVKGLAVNTIGEVVTSGASLMEILPIEEKLVVAIRIMTADMGHVTVGQSANVKVNSYDFGRYGVVPGKLVFISATTFVGANGEKFYRGRVELDRNYVGDREDLQVLPGMSVQAGIVTGEKTIIEYLLKPIQRAFESGLNER